MEFKPAKCPNCGGNLQVPPDLKTAKCMYCGTNFLIEQAIKLAGVKINLDNLFILADTARDTSNYKEAYNYYTRILEVDSDNYKAWYGKAISAGWQSTPDNLRLQEAVKGIEIAISKTPNDKIEFLKKEASADLNNLANANFKLAFKNIFNNMNEENYRKFIRFSKYIVSTFELSFKYDPNDKKILDNIIHVIKTYTTIFTSQGKSFSLSNRILKEEERYLLQTKERIKQLDPNYLKKPKHLNTRYISIGNIIFISVIFILIGLFVWFQNH